jgi:flagellar FliL protein
MYEVGFFDEYSNTCSIFLEWIVMNYRKTLLILILIFIFIVLGISGSIAWMALSTNDDEDDKIKRMVDLKHSSGYGSSSIEEYEKSRLDVGAIYTLEMFVVNVKDKSGKTDLKLEVSFEMTKNELSAELEEKTALFRDKIIVLISSKSMEQISTNSGKDRLKKEIMAKINPLLKDDKIKNIYFPTFIAK